MGSDRARYTASSSGLCKCSKTCTPNTRVPTSHTPLNIHTQHTCAHKPHTTQHAHPTHVCSQATRRSTCTPNTHVPTSHTPTLFSVDNIRGTAPGVGLWSPHSQTHKHAPAYTHGEIHLVPARSNNSHYTRLIEKKSSTANVFLLGSDR